MLLTDANTQEMKLERRELLRKLKSDGWKLSPMGLYQKSTQTLKRKSLRKLKNQSNQEIVSLKLVLFQHWGRSEPHPVFLSTYVAEAFKHNSKASAPSGQSILEYLKKFDSVFSKESFDALPESKKWDHAIKLIPGEKASNCKVYPLAPMEQKELDQFLKENLETGRIRPLK